MLQCRRLPKQRSCSVLMIVACVLAGAAQQPPRVQRAPVPAAARVTRTTLGAVVPQGKPCPLTVNFNGTITTNGPAEVKYTWVSSDGGTWPEHTLNFAKAGMEKVTEQRQVPVNTTGWMQLKVLSPNAVLSNRANFKVTCGSAGGAGKVTRATLAVTNPSAGKPCPQTLNFNGSITTTGPADVKYTWVSSDGSTWPEHSLHFAKAGTERANETWQLGASSTVWVQLKVLAPNPVLSNRATARVTCPVKK